MLKHIVFALGLALTICGWFVRNAERYTVIYRIVAPDYYDALAVGQFLQAFDDKADRDFTVKDRGFRTLAGYLAGLFQDQQGNTMQASGLSVEKVTIHGGLFGGRVFMEIGPGVDERGNAGNYRYVSVAFKDRNGNLGTTEKSRLVDFDSKFLAHYRGKRIVVAAEVVFWLGIAVTLVSHWIKNRPTIRSQATNSGEDSSGKDDK